MKHTLGRSWPGTTLRLIALAVCALAAAPTARAQDAHYWGDQWGTRANLLGGVVIGSRGDLSSTYYNPGWLALGLDTSSFIATKVYELNSLRLPADNKNSIDISNTRVDAAPDFIAGEIRLPWSGGGRFAYSLLTRQSMKLELKAREVQPAPGSGGAQSPLNSGELFNQEDVTEVWGGVSYARPLAENLGLGATLYGAYRSQRIRRSFTLAVSDSNSVIDMVSGISDGSYWNGRLLMKFGLAWERKDFTLGLSLTTPSLSILGQGTYFEQAAGNGVPDLGPPYDDAYQSAVLVEGLDARYETSWALGVGGSYAIGELRLHFAGEYFAKVGPFQIMHVSPWFPQSGGLPIERSVDQRLEAVLNFGIGWQVPLSESWLAYGSIITDHSAAPTGAERSESVAIAAWDVYQISAGGELMFGKGTITIGLAYAFSNDTVALENAIYENGAPIPNNELAVRYRRLKLLLGGTIQF